MIIKHEDFIEVCNRHRRPQQPRIKREGDKVFVLTDCPKTEIGRYEAVALISELCRAVEGGVVRELLTPETEQSPTPKPSRVESK